MRFAIATVDKFDGVLKSLLAAGWQPLKLFTYSLDGRFHGVQVSDWAFARGLPVQVSRATADDLAALSAQGCEALVVAGYRWKVPDWRPHLRYAVNFHPSPLPVGRGPWPLLRAIREGHRSWGVSCHRLGPELDRGEILDREDFPLDEDESQESLDLRCQLAYGRLAKRVAADFPRLWDAARPQDPALASYFPRATPRERLLDLRGTVAEAKRQLRAFGALECTAQIPTLVYVRRAVAWTEPHAHAPGSLVHRQGRQFVFALQDGYIGLLEWSLLPAEIEPRPGA